MCRDGHSSIQGGVRMSEETRMREEGPSAPAEPLSRRRFLGGVGGAAVALTVGAAAGQAGEPAPADTEAAAIALAEEMKLSPQMAKAAVRRERSYQLRTNAAKSHRGKALVAQTPNGDEARYPNRIGNYSKGLPHNAFGEVDPAAYESLREAGGSSDPAAYAAIRTSGGQ